MGPLWICVAPFLGFVFVFGPLWTCVDNLFLGFVWRIWGPGRVSKKTRGFLGKTYGLEVRCEGCA